MRKEAGGVSHNTQEGEADRSELFKRQPGLCRETLCQKTENDLKCHKTKSKELYEYDLCNSHRFSGAKIYSVHLPMLVELVP